MTYSSPRPCFCVFFHLNLRSQNRLMPIIEKNWMCMCFLTTFLYLFLFLSLSSAPRGRELKFVHNFLATSTNAFTSSSATMNATTINDAIITTRWCCSPHWREPLPKRTAITATALSSSHHQCCNPKSYPHSRCFRCHHRHQHSKHHCLGRFLFFITPV